jgi:hypothetical protein
MVRVAGWDIVDVARPQPSKPAISIKPTSTSGIIFFSSVPPFPGRTFYLHSVVKGKGGLKQGKKIAPSLPRRAILKYSESTLSPFPFTGNTAVSSDAVETFHLPAVYHG